MFEELARVPGGPVEDELVDPALALGEHAAQHGQRLDQLPQCAVEGSCRSGVASAGSPSTSRRRLGEHAGTDQQACAEQQGDHDREEDAPTATLRRMARASARATMGLSR